MKIHYIVTSIILVSMIVLGATTYVSDLGDSYSTSTDLTGLDDTRDRLETQQEDAQSLSDDITEFKLESVTDFLSIPYKMIKIGWKIARTMFSSWITVAVMTTESGDLISESGIPLPDWLIPSLIALLIFTLVAIITYAWFKWEFKT